MIKEVFGKVLKQLREESKISQETLADKAQLDRTYISMLERGIRQPTLSTIFSLADALGMQPSSLIQRLEKMILNSSNEAPRQ